ncbi:MULTISPECIES: thiolase family protein [Cupriavidus]|uniref:propanoyl-CoA C-acyltransferase n=1 Tax=Cupriavidus taiwanensis TaxID=164546 RepID=A0A976AM89_9BURK|nr:MULTISPECIES: thiolase family protein [Cupriavidus]MEC3764528.1 thiolase family protein [Cupriavidus sp. SS-3]SOY92718.1 Sulfonate transport system substrate-binding protein [Cupriavidus taiwanensis]SOY97087.1 Sulfonate transport system substrate-binding protein [Cupriavidus taiwanensis]SPD68525.1 Thiolase [Cupriavidus taiwanensis]
MQRTLNDMRPVYVIGAGWHRYQPLSEDSYATLGLAAVRGALADAGIEWAAVESAYFAKALLPMAPGRPMLRHLGATGIPVMHVENASASGSAAFRQACMEVASGMCEVALAVGVDKPAPVTRGEAAMGIPQLAEDAIVPFTHFALLADQYAQRHGVDQQDFARVAVKNHGNGARNPNAHRQQPRTLEEVLGGRPVSGSLTTLQCCPVGEGAAAVIVASEAAIRRLGVDGGKPVRVTASAARSQRLYEDATRFDANLTEETTRLALQQAGLRPEQIDVLELHDAFTVEEVEYVEAMGLCGPGRAVPMLREGAWDIGGRCAVNPSGGLIAMGHPIGPTGIGQVGEIALQLRGEAGARQHPGARVGLAHMVGVGAVCYVHTLQRD